MLLFDTETYTEAEEINTLICPNVKRQLDTLTHLDSCILKKYAPTGAAAFIEDIFFQDEEYDNDNNDKTEAPKDSPKTTKMLRRAYELVISGAWQPHVGLPSPQDMRRTPREISESTRPLKLYPYQRAGAGRLQVIMNKEKSGLLSWEMGLGKTITVIAYLISMGFIAKDPARTNGPVLLVLPGALILPWIKALRIHLKTMPRICIYRNLSGSLHEPMFDGVAYSTDFSPLQLCHFDIVVTTYATVRLEFVSKIDTRDAFDSWRLKHIPTERPDHGKFPLFATKWWHLVMDEAHIATTPSSKVHHAICALDVEYRLAMTGTPLQNSLEDIQGMLALLHIYPWSDLEYFLGYYNIRKTKATIGIIGRLKTTLICTLKAISLRLRVHDDFNGERAARFTKVEPVIIEHLLDEEQQAYQELVEHLWDPAAKAQRKEDKRNGDYIGDGLGSGGIFPAIMEARLAAIHPLCAEAKYGEPEVADLNDARALLRVSGISPHFNDGETDMSRNNLENDRRKFFRANIEEDQRWKSERINRTVDIALDQKKKGRKIVCFSNFICALDALDAALRANGIRTIRYDGSKSLQERNKAIEDFATDAYDVMLMTLKTGGAGLNLQMAKVVVQLDVCWNPTILTQGDARVNRDGNSDVEIFYFLAKDSIETHIWGTASQKRQTATNILDPDDREMENVNNAASLSFEEYLSIMHDASETAEEYAKQKAASKKKRSGESDAESDAETDSDTDE
ncbi:hypothetical protein B5807_00052 [Epicoccum nigrum]|uniref:Helicase ATP-binding domain-containing protein n=1 Tax=Epicoccum nigrum TaxID=105696 RepID=A0A1Y2MFI2_EPING|nr:hypothetical protein B5807_00052 [Epicoccum nigrum]